MAASNRTTGKADVTALAATVDLAELKTSLNLIWDSALLNRDVSNTVAVSGAATTIDFSGYDTIIANTTQSTAITISNLIDSEFKYLIINKNASNAITFANATDMSYNLVYNNTLTLLVYKIVSKGSAGIIAYPLHKTLDYSALLTSASLLPGEWQEASLSSPWLGANYATGRIGLWYRISNGYLDIDCSITRSLAFSGNITTLPEGYRPSFGKLLAVNFHTLNCVGMVKIATDGLITVNMFSGEPLNVFFSTHIPLT